MFNKIVATTRTQTASIILAFALAFISFSVLAPAASAQVRTSGVTSELQAQIAALMAQIAALQGGTTTPSTPAGSKVFTIGAAVQPTANIRVRTEPGITSAIVGTENTGSRGIVTAGPVKQGGYNWYKVDFKAGASGWVTGWWLKGTTSGLDEYGCTPGASCPGTVLSRDLQPLVKEISSIAQLDTRSAGAKGISMIGSFEIEITAQDSPLYLNPDTFNVFPSVGEKSTATDNPMLSKTVASNALKSGVYYFVGEGETRTFKVTFEYFPREKGTYVMIMQNFDFAITAVGRPFTHELYPNRPESNGVLYYSEPTTLPYVTITNITSGLMPIISGNTEERVMSLGLSIAGPSGDKVYGSGVIPVTKGKWSHIVGTALPKGINEVVVYADNKEVARKKFMVGDSVQSDAVVNSFMATPSSAKSGSTIKLSWVTTGTSQCNVFDTSYGELSATLVKSNLSSNGSLTVTAGGKESLKENKFLLRCQKASTLKDSVVEATVRVALVYSINPVPPVVKPTPRFNGLTYPVGTPNAAVSAVFNSPKTTATGPVVLGYIKWGEAGTATQTVSAIPNGTQTTVELKHTYRAAGDYTISLIGLDGKIVTERVKATFPVVLPKPAAISTTSSSSGLVKGAATTDQLAEIQMTLTNIQTILSELE